MIRNWSIVLLLAPWVWLPGCVLLDPTDPYAGAGSFATGESFRSSSQSAATQSVQGPLTLERAIEVALANNPDVAAIRHDLQAAGAQTDVARGALLPSVHGLGGYNHYLDSQRLIPASENNQPGVFGPDIFSGDLVVTMPIYTGGRLSSEVNAAKLLQQSASHQLARSREELVFNVSSVFYGILAQRHVIESLGFSQKALEEHLKRVNDLIDAQKAAKVDRLRTEVRLADLKQQIVRERNVLAIEERVLTNLLGVRGGSSPPTAAGELASPSETPAISVEDATSTAIKKRDDYLAARASLEAQAKRVDAARAAQWPTVFLQGSYGGRWAADTTDHPSGTSSSDDVGRVGVYVDIPIFEGGRIEAGIREQKAKLAAAQERLRKLELQVRLDVETAVLNIASAQERVVATEAAIDQAKESLRIEQEKYDLGKGSITDVLDAQSALLNSQTNYYRALSDYSTAKAQLRLAIGATTP